MNWGYNPPRDAGKKKNGNHQNISQNLKKTRHTPELHPKNNNKSPKIPQDPPKSPKIPSKSPQNPPKIPQFTMVFWCLPHQVTLIEVLNPVPSAVVVGSTGSSSSMKRSTYCRRAAASCGGERLPRERSNAGEKWRNHPGKLRKLWKTRGNSPGKIGKTMENLLISWGTIWRESIEGCGFQKRWIRC